ncbi:peptidase inhibitor I9 [Cladorrhinum sp. PSN259]|nr:peptidase inhibitor I9 [Cladorrhinum sp. PSN259]
MGPLRSSSASRRLLGVYYKKAPEPKSVLRFSFHKSSSPSNRNLCINQAKPSAIIMPSFIVTLKDNASDEDLAQAKQKIKDQGGDITHEYSLIKGFAYTVPEGTVQTLDSEPYVEAVEQDQEVRTQ